MTDKVAILVFKESGKYYTGDENTYYDVPENFEPWEKQYNDWVKTHEVVSPGNFTFLVLDHPDNEKFWMKLLIPSPVIINEEERTKQIVEILKNLWHETHMSDMEFDKIAKNILNISR